MARLFIDRIWEMVTRERQSQPSRSFWRSHSAYTSTAREVIDENTTVSYSAVWRGFELLGGVMARMPKALVREQDESNKSLVATHPVAKLLRRRVSPEQTSYKWFEQTTGLTMLWGQSFSEISRTNSRLELYPLHPSRMRMDRGADGRIVYEYTAEQGRKVTYSPDQIVHITMPGFDGYTGLGLMALAKHSIGLALALQKYGGALFGNNAIPGLVLEHPGPLGEEGMQNLRESVEARHRGADKAHTPLILEEGMKASNLAPPNDAAQFNESRGMQVLELARFMGVSPHLLFWLDRSTFSNIEHQGIEFVKYTVANWIGRFTSEMEAKLLPDEDRLQIEFDTSEIEKGDSETFSKVQERRLQNGIISFNEARRSLGLNTLGPDGDIRIVNSTMMLSDRLLDEPQEPPDTAPQGSQPDAGDQPDDQPPEDDTSTERARRACALVLREAMESLIGQECDRLERVLKKGAAAGDTAKRVQDFYEQFESRIAVAFTPAFGVWDEMTGADSDVGNLADDYAGTQCESVLRAIDAEQDPQGVIDEWRNSRADQVTAMYFGGSDDHQ